MNSHDPHPIETIKLSDRDKTRLVQALEAQASQQAGGGQGNRRNLRVGFHGRNVLISMNPMGAHVRYSVVPRNLSRGGLAFIHGRYIYPNTACTVNLAAFDGQVHSVEAKVLRCRHIGGIVHEVSLQFEDPIDLERFVPLSPEQAEAHRQERAEHEADKPVRLAGGPSARVLLVDDFAADRKLLGLHLRNQGLAVVDAEDRAAGLRLLERQSYDLAVIDLNLGRDDGLELVRQCRASGFTAPLIAVSADDSDQMQARALEAGANAFLAKPFRGEQLAETVEQLLSVHAASDGGSIRSALADDRTMRPLVREFVTGLGESIERLREAGPRDDVETVREVCQQLKGAGTSYGFEAITSTAALVLESIDSDTRQVEQVRSSVNDLLALLRRVEFV